MLYASPLITVYTLVVTAILGLCMGSFLNCWAWRIVHGESILKGRSHCPDCNHELAAKDLVPIVSWLSSHGKCRYCGGKVSARYPITEAVCAIVFVTIVMRYDISLEALEMLVFSSTLFVLSLTDLEDYLIPNGCIIVAITTRVIYILVAGLLNGLDIGAAFIDSLIGGGAIFVALLIIVLIFDKVLGRESMGGGDLKLFFVAGFYFGWQQGLLLIILACIIGIVLALLGVRKQTQNADESKKHSLIPFGPSIAIACWITMLVGVQVLGWYMGLF